MSQFIIDYTVSPIFRIPMKWRTKITDVDFQKSFTDFQEKGPYKYWNHFHELINYEMPFSILGTIAHQLFVKRKLESIFSYRYQYLEKTFNQKEL